MSCQHDSDGKCRCVQPADTCCKEIGLYGKHSHGPELKKYLNITGFADIDQFLDDVFDTMAKKGHDYRQGNDSDLLHNFRTVANAVGTDMEKVWFTYFYKHYSAMVTFIKEGGQSESEPIEGRIKDQIVYLVLFWKMVQERRRQAELARPKEVAVEKEYIAKSEVTNEQVNETLSQLQEELRKATEHLPLRRVKASPTLDVPVGKGVVEVDPQRMYELAGGAGTFVPPEVKRRAGEIHQKIAARDEEARKQESWLGRPYVEKEQLVDETAIREALLETRPLHEREALGKEIAESLDYDPDEIQQGRAANGAFDGPVPSDIPF